MKSGFVYSKSIGSKYSMKAIKSIDLEKKNLNSNILQKWQANLKIQP